jgi:hypothetical protein
LPQLGEINVPRCTQPNSRDEDCELHAFVDASLTAFGAVVYSRTIDEQGKVTVRFVVAKAKVTPLQVVSIPRLELMAAVLGVRLVEVESQSSVDVE